MSIGNQLGADRGAGGPIPGRSPVVLSSAGQSSCVGDWLESRSFIGWAVAGPDWPMAALEERGRMCTELGLRAEEIQARQVLVSIFCLW